MTTDQQSSSLHGSSLSASLTVSDIAASLAWYTETLGFTVAQRMEREGVLRGAALLAGNVRILINQDDGAKGLNRALGEGFSLMIRTAQDIDGVAAGIRARGGALLSEPADMPWGVRMFRVQDPDGYNFAISSEPA